MAAEKPWSAPVCDSRLNIRDLARLGERAKLRREALKLTMANIAEVTGIKKHNLNNWERQLPVRPQPENESLLEDVLRVPRGWLRDERIATPSIEPPPPISLSIHHSNCIAEEIHAIGCWLTRQSVGKRTSDYSALSPQEKRAADVFALRYGTDGEATLQEVGNRYGVTRERIRQVVQKMLNRASYVQVTTPLLDKLANDVRPYLPATVAELDKTFRELLGKSLSITCADRFAREVLGRGIVTLTNQPADMAAPWDTAVAVDPHNHNAEMVRAVREVAMRMIRSCGAAQAQFVAGATGGILNHGITPTEAIRSCKVVDGFEWLAEEDGWFWFGSESDNRLLSVTKKVLAVAEYRVDIEDIQNALTRSRRNNYNPQAIKPYLVEPPISVLAAALQRVPWIQTIQHDDFRLMEHVALETILSDAELAVYRVMKAKGGMAARYTLKKELVDTGILQAITLHMSLDGSPIFIHLNRGVFALRGNTLTPEGLATEVAAVGGDAIRTKRLEQATPNSEGYFACRVELSQYMLDRRFWELPAALTRVMNEGSYQVEGFNEPAAYSSTASGAHRLKSFVNKLVTMGLKVGDQVVMHVNPEKRHIVLERAN